MTSPTADGKTQPTKCPSNGKPIYWAAFRNDEMIFNNVGMPRLYQTKKSAKRFNSDIRRVQVFDYFDPVEEKAPKRGNK